MQIKIEAFAAVKAGDHAINVSFSRGGVAIAGEVGGNRFTFQDKKILSDASKLIVGSAELAPHAEMHVSRGYPTPYTATYTAESGAETTVHVGRTALDLSSGVGISTNPFAPIARTDTVSITVRLPHNVTLTYGVIVSTTPRPQRPIRDPSPTELKDEARAALIALAGSAATVGVVAVAVSAFQASGVSVSSPRLPIIEPVGTH